MKIGQEVWGTWNTFKSYMHTDILLETNILGVQSVIKITWKNKKRGDGNEENNWDGEISYDWPLQGS